MKRFLLALIFLTLSLPVHAALYINEISPSTDPEWIELYNDGDSVDLENWLLTDNNSSTTDDLTLTGTINSGEYLVFSRSSGWLNNSGDIVSLYNNATPSAELIDQYEYGSVSADQSVSRSPDGADSWIITISSEGLTNPTPEPSPTPTPTPTSTPTSTPKPSSETSTPTPSPSPIGVESPRPSSDLKTQTGTVAGLTVDSIHLTPVRSISPEPSPSLQGPSSQAPALNHTRAKTALLVGLGLITISTAGFFGLRKFRSINQL